MHRLSPSMQAVHQSNQDHPAIYAQELKDLLETASIDASRLCGAGCAIVPERTHSCSASALVTQGLLLLQLLLSQRLCSVSTSHSAVSKDRRIPCAHAQWGDTGCSIKRHH